MHEYKRESKRLLYTTVELVFCRANHKLILQTNYDSDYCLAVNLSFRKFRHLRYDRENYERARINLYGVQFQTRPIIGQVIFSVPKMLVIHFIHKWHSGGTAPVSLGTRA